jgi:hypothetical protein
MDTFTTRKPPVAGGHRHHSAQGFCTVCGTAWPCWRGLGEDTGFDAVARTTAPPLSASVGGRPW